MKINQPDLFGYTRPAKTWEQEYREYLSSKKWKDKCKQALTRTGEKCERCGFGKWSYLSVHHLRYDNFKDEPPEDLEVVCRKCHKIEDLKRQEQTIARSDQKLEDARFEGWVRKVYGDNAAHMDQNYLYEEYREWLDTLDEFY